jgi:hypothetical protein
VSDFFSKRMIEAAKAYFAAVDSGRLPDELFTPDFEFFFPKYGVGRGVDEFHALAAGLGAAGYKATHYRDRLKYLVSGQQLIVEGTTFGSDGHGGAWDPSREWGFPRDPQAHNTILSVVLSIRRRSAFYNKICQVRTQRGHTQARMPPVMSLSPASGTGFVNNMPAKMSASTA